MADFRKALPITLKHEGGYAFDPDDPGGETYKGVARRHNQDWKGWIIIDDMKRKPNFPESLKDTVIDNLIHQLYKAKYWDVIKGDEIENQSIANKLFDCGINMGPITASRLAQIAIGVLVDGKIGPKTLSALNGFNFDLFMCQFRLAIISRYVSICEKRHTSRKYFFGWVKRALS